MGIRPGQAKGPYVGPLDSNGNWLPPVISLFDPSAGLPVTPVLGDMYISLGTANGWTANYIETWNGIQWTGKAPVAGMVTFATALDQMYVYDLGYWRIYGDFWLKPVKSIFDNTTALPVAPAAGDRYLALKTAHGWSIDNIYEWDGVQWIRTLPVPGCIIYNLALNIPYEYTGAVWTVLVATLFGTGAAPDPTNLPDGTLYIMYTP